MKIDIKVLLGLGIAGFIGYYLWNKSKEKTSNQTELESSQTEEKKESEVDVTEFFAKEDVTLGFVPNTNQSNVLFRKGDKVEGVRTTRYGAFGVEEKGIMAKPTVSTAILPIGGSGLFFVPFQKLESKTTTKYFISDSGQVTRPEKM